MEKHIRTFRFTGTGEQTEAIADMLRAQGFRFEALPFHPDAMLLLEEPFPLGSSLAAKFGYIYIQDASSMLPALALAKLIAADAASASGPAANGNELAVLDMCSSPGGKSSLLARALGAARQDGAAPSGFVLANEPGVKRLGTLRRNLLGMNMLNSGTCSFGGESFPLPSAGTATSGTSAPGMTAHGTTASCTASDDEAIFPGWDYILLDPPCSGWGTVEKNPQVLSLWQGDKVKPLVGLQRMLLREAFRLLRPGGCLTYSTCTVNMQENEEQVRWALSELDAEMGGGAVSLLPLENYAGFAFEAPWPDGATDSSQAGQGADCSGVLRVSMDSPLGQGFFIAALRKAEDAAPLPVTRKNSDATSGSQSKKRATGIGQKAGQRSGYGSGQRGAGSGQGHGESGAVFLPPAAIEAPLVSASLLPPGQLAIQRGNLSFLPQAGVDILPESFKWDGYQLGKSTGEGSRPRLDTSVRALMPSAREAAARGADVLDVDDPAVVCALLSGQSLTFAAKGAEVGLYFKGLPLCRLKARGNRVFI
ncbi:RsmB/NOP family class I SAM-dependent RNA methyltransferase [Desulfovibrio sp. OttesenSCG-928-C06]|nr:RsmB/NOP family class I SAM-dependent RNA methyltransferase [Desulfovibrio sp. OttesenSCG-928-C06]